eukprot:gene7669-9133_t
MYEEQPGQGVIDALARERQRYILETARVVRGDRYVEGYGDVSDPVLDTEAVGDLVEVLRANLFGKPPSGNKVARLLWERPGPSAARTGCPCPTREELLREKANEANSLKQAQGLLNKEIGHLREEAGNRVKQQEKLERAIIELSLENHVCKSQATAGLVLQAERLQAAVLRTQQQRQAKVLFRMRNFHLHKALHHWRAVKDELRKNALERAILEKESEVLHFKQLLREADVVVACGKRYMEKRQSRAWRPPRKFVVSLYFSDWKCKVKDEQKFRVEEALSEKVERIKQLESELRVEKISVDNLESEIRRLEPIIVQQKDRIFREHERHVCAVFGKLRQNQLWKALFSWQRQARDLVEERARLEEIERARLDKGVHKVRMVRGWLTGGQSWGKGGVKVDGCWVFTGGVKEEINRMRDRSSWWREQAVDLRHRVQNAVIKRARLCGLFWAWGVWNCAVQASKTKISNEGRDFDSKRYHEEYERLVRLHLQARSDAEHWEAKAERVTSQVRRLIGRTITRVCDLVMASAFERWRETAATNVRFARVERCLLRIQQNAVIRARHAGFAPFFYRWRERTEAAKEERYWQTLHDHQQERAWAHLRQLSQRVARRVMINLLWQYFARWRIIAQWIRNFRSNQKTLEAQIAKLAKQLEPLQREVGILRLFRDALSSNEHTIMFRKGGGYMPLDEYIAKLESKMAAAAVEQDLRDWTLKSKKADRYGLGGTVSTLVNHADEHGNQGEDVTPRGSRAAWNSSSFTPLHLSQPQQGRSPSPPRIRSSHEGDLDEQRRGRSLSPQRDKSPILRIK